MSGTVTPPSSSLRYEVDTVLLPQGPEAISFIDVEVVEISKAVEGVLRFLGHGSVKVLNVAELRCHAGEWAYSFAKLLDRVING